MKIYALFGAAALFLPAIHADSPTSGVLGDWREPAGSVIRIAPCGGSLCATLVAISKGAPTRVDGNNPDPAQRNRPLCGLQIGEGFHGKDPNRAEGGRLYDPRSGKTYKGNMTSEGNTLLLRGFIGVAMFGRTARWDRVAEPVEACTAKAWPSANPAGDVPAVPGPPT